MNFKTIQDEDFLEKEDIPAYEDWKKHFDKSKNKKINSVQKKGNSDSQSNSVSFNSLEEKKVPNSTELQQTTTTMNFKEISSRTVGSLFY
jgi:hypothetical protein